MLLDGPTWLSLVHELWEQDGALEDPSCAQETLCRMNRMAMAAPGQAGWAVSLSRYLYLYQIPSFQQLHPMWIGCNIFGRKNIYPPPTSLIKSNEI